MNKMLTDVQGMKALLLDEETVRSPFISHFVTFYFWDCLVSLRWE